MPAKRYKVVLTQSQRDYLIDLISCGKESARKLTRARILLLADQSPNGRAWEDHRIVEALEVSRPTVERIRQTLVTDGLLKAINRKKRAACGYVIFDGEKEAHLVALTCSKPPDGREKWSLQLLADKMVELNHFNRISHEAIRQVLKKTNLSLG